MRAILCAFAVLATLALLAAMGWEAVSVIIELGAVGFESGDDGTVSVELLALAVAQHKLVYLGVGAVAGVVLGAAGGGLFRALSDALSDRY